MSKDRRKYRDYTEELMACTKLFACGIRQTFDDVKILPIALKGLKEIKRENFKTYNYYTSRKSKLEAEKRIG